MLQAQVSPRLLFCILQRQWDLDDGAVIEQVVTKTMVGAYMLEHLRVLLERGRYRRFGHFQTLSAKIDYNLLTNDPEFLKTHHPDFYRKMADLGLLDAAKLRAAPLSFQKAWLDEYLTKDGEVFTLGIYRVSAALMLSLDARMARDIAEIIRQTPFSKSSHGRQWTTLVM